MLKSFAKVNKLAIPVLVLVVLLVPLLIYERYYVHMQDKYLDERAFRVLMVAADEIRASFQMVSTALSGAAAVQKEQREQFLGLIFRNQNFQVTSSPEVAVTRKGTTSLVIVNPYDLTVRGTYTEGDSGDTNSAGEGCKTAPSATVYVCTQLTLQPQLRRILDDLHDEQFDQFLVADQNGRVLVTDQGSVLQMQDLKEVLRQGVIVGRRADPAATGDKSPSKQQEAGLENLSSSSTLMEVSIAGAAYRLYIQPMTFRSDFTGRSEPMRLVVCGLRRSDRHTSESTSIPYPVLIWGGLFVLLVGSIVWPFVKINYMNRTERLRRRHGWYLVISTAGATAIATLMVLNASFSYHAKAATRRELKSLATLIASNWQWELKRAVRELERVSGELRTSPTTLSSGIPAWNPVSHYLLNATRASRYPWFDNAFLARRADGWQTAKVSVRPIPTPQTRVDRYNFFRDIVEKRFVPDRNFKEITVQSLPSPNTGEFYTAIARNEVAWRGIAVLVTQPLSLVEPVLPPGYGFAVLDESGGTVFHSQVSRNLHENFLQECGDPLQMKATLFSAGDSWVDTQYMGRPHQIFATRLATMGERPYTLVVFRDSRADVTVHLAIVAITATLLSLYILPVFLITALTDLARDHVYPPQFVWPKKENAATYLHVFIANSVPAAYYLLIYPELALWPAIAGGLLTAATAMGATVLKIYARERDLRLMGFSLIGCAVAAPLAMISFGSSPVTGLAVQVGSGLGVAAFSAWWYGTWQWIAVLTAAAGISAIHLSNKDVTARLDGPTVQYHFKKAYALLGIGLLSSVIMVPTFGFFKVGYDAVNRLALKHEQLSVSQRLARRETAIRDMFRDIAPDKVVQARLNEPLDRYEKLIVDGRAQFASGPAGEPDTHVRVPEGWFERQMAKATCLFPCNDVAAQMSRVAFASQTGNIHLWTEPHADVLRLQWAGPSGELQEIDSPVRKWSGLHPAGRLLLALVWVLSGVWMFNLIKHVFMPDLRAAPALPRYDWSRADDVKSNFLVIGHPRSERSRRLKAIRDAVPVDFQASYSRWKSRERWTPLIPIAPLLIIDHFDYCMADPTVNRMRLDLLEELLYRRQQKLMLACSVDPMCFLTEERDIALGPELTEVQRDELLHRWARVFSRFTRAELADSSHEHFDNKLRDYRKDPDPVKRRLAELVAAECDSTAYLRRLGIRILQNRACDPVSDRGMDSEWLISKVLDEARPFYHALWSSFTAAERLVLFQIAADGWPNPQNPDAIQQLQRREFIRRDGTFRIMNASFRRFILSVERPAEIAQWESEEQASSWKALRMGMITVMIAVACWLLYAQKDLFQVSLGYIVALGGAATAVLNVLGKVKKTRPD